jgi:hypothetical protein
MVYTVQVGDSLWRIAGHAMGNPARWTEIAKMNHLARPDRLLVGQRLFLPSALPGSPKSASPLRGHTAAPVGHALPMMGSPLHAGGSDHSFEKQTPLLPAWLHYFILADEWNPVAGKLVRKVVFPTGPLSPEEIARILKPDVYGMAPRSPGSPVSLGRHVLGRTDSKFISASKLPKGSPRFEGEPFWIDEAKLKASGAKVFDGPAIAKDLARIMAKTKNQKFIEFIKDISEKSSVADREVVIEPAGNIPAGAIKGAAAMQITRGLQLLMGVAIVLTTVDLVESMIASYQKKSAVPIVRAAVRQSAGWKAAGLGAAAGRAAFTWAARRAAAAEGIEIGGIAGGALGIETGPGALVTAAAGSLIFGTAAFFGADWATKKLFGGN